MTSHKYSLFCRGTFIKSAAHPVCHIFIPLLCTPTPTPTADTASSSNVIHFPRPYIHRIFLLSCPRLMPSYIAMYSSDMSVNAISSYNAAFFRNTILLTRIVNEGCSCRVGSDTRCQLCSTSSQSLTRNSRSQPEPGFPCRTNVYFGSIIAAAVCISTWNDMTL